MLTSSKKTLDKALEVVKVQKGVNFGMGFVPKALHVLVGGLFKSTSLVPFSCFHHPNDHHV
jgi:hypothetical protein